jgi:hypothetical protein
MPGGCKIYLRFRQSICLVQSRCVCDLTLFDEQALARLGAVGLTWGETGFALASDRSPLENRPWSPAPAPPRDDRIVRPGHGGSHGADPADAADEPQEQR